MDHKLHCTVRLDGTVDGAHLREPKVGKAGMIGREGWKRIRKIYWMGNGVEKSPIGSASRHSCETENQAVKTRGFLLASASQP